MKYTLNATGFCAETLTVEVSPSFKAEEIMVSVSTDAFIIDTESIHTELVCDINSFGYYKNFRDNGHWDSDYNRWIEEPTAMVMHVIATPATIKQTLVNLAKEFNEFHQKQNETAKMTVKAINSLRIEDVVGEYGWEVVKTTSRRGSRRG